MTESLLLRFLRALIALLAVAFYITSYVTIARGNFGWTFADVACAALLWFGAGPARRQR